jgi:hypothetical protein
MSIDIELTDTLLTMFIRGNLPSATREIQIRIAEHP